MKNLVIYGAGGFGREVAWLVQRINKIRMEWNILGFIDDEKTEMYGASINGIAVLGGREWFDTNKKEVYVSCAMGRSLSRRKIYSSLEMFCNIRLATLVDPSVILADTASIGVGSILCCGSRIMVNARLGKGVVLNTGSAVGHDAELDDYCTLLTNVMVSGTARIGENTEIGSGAFVLEFKTVGRDIVIAPLASVLTDISAGGTYAGNPARRIR